MSSEHMAVVVATIVRHLQKHKSMYPTKTGQGRQTDMFVTCAVSQN